MKSTDQRDIYAEALDTFKREVPINQWPRYGQTLSKSGLEQAMRRRGYPRFERKRLESTACKHIYQEMLSCLAEWLSQQSPEKEVEKPTVELRTDPTPRPRNTDVERLQREVGRLEKELKKLQRSEKAYQRRCALLEEKLEALTQQRSAFEQHCTRSLRTLHV